MDRYVGEGDRSGQDRKMGGASLRRRPESGEIVLGLDRKGGSKLASKIKKS